MKFKHLFGPVPSRRLGISLGVDLVPPKICSQDCIYCEVGKTTRLTLKRKEYVRIDNVIKELDSFLKQEPNLDYITFSGAGEPTLNSGIGKLIKFIKGKYPSYKIALITNSTLLAEDDLQKDLNQIDVILPSLDAASDEVFSKLNKPHRDLSVNMLIEGLIKTREMNYAKMLLEIFLAPGYNDSIKELKLLKNACRKINPHCIQLNTLDRPGIDQSLTAITDSEMEHIREFFLPLPVEIISKASLRKQKKSYHNDIADAIINTIGRRPCTDLDLCQFLGLHINELNKYLGTLLSEKKIRKRQGKRGIFFELF